MTLKLISHKLCPYVQRAVIALTEKGVAFERIDIDLANKPDWQGPLRSGDRDHSTPIPRNSRHARRHESHLV